LVFTFLKRYMLANSIRPIAIAMGMQWLKIRKIRSNLATC